MVLGPQLAGAFIFRLCTLTTWSHSKWFDISWFCCRKETWLNDRERMSCSSQSEARWPPPLGREARYKSSNICIFNSIYIQLNSVSFGQRWFKINFYKQTWWGSVGMGGHLPRSGTRSWSCQCTGEITVKTLQIGFLVTCARSSIPPGLAGGGGCWACFPITAPFIIAISLKWEWPMMTEG